MTAIRTTYDISRPVTPSGSYWQLAQGITAHGSRGFSTYQPASRYWAFQGIETGIFVIVAASWRRFKPIVFSTARAFSLCGVGRPATRRPRSCYYRA